MYSFMSQGGILIDAIEPSSKSPDPYANMYGTINATSPSRKALKPMIVAFPSHIGLAANAASATGGVIHAILEKYRINKCAASTGIPMFTRAGAVNAAWIT